MSIRPLPSIAPPAGTVDRRVLAGLRTRPTSGISRRTLLRRTLGAGLLVWLTESVAATVGFWWPTAAIGAPRVRIGTLDDLIAANTGLPVPMASRLMSRRPGRS